jgi:hypothetical protein
MRKLFLVCVVLLVAVVASAATAPRVIAIFPSEGVEVGLNAPVLISFDQSMDQNSVENSIRIEPESIVTFNWLDGQTLQLLPQTQWARATRYAVTISTDAKAATGDAFEESYTFQFQTAGVLSVVSVTPEDGNQLVTVAQGQISVAFDRPVVPLVSSADQADLPVPVIVDPPIDGEGQWITTSLYIITAASPLDSSTQYTVTVPAGLAAIDGSVLEEDFIWQFRTLAPQVTGINATNQFTNGRLLLDSGFYVEFSQSMEHETAQNALSVLIDGETVPGRFEWRTNDRRMYFYPEELLPNAAEIEVSLDNSARTEDGFGVLESPVELTLTTVELPRIESVIPSQEVVPSGYINVVFTFNTAINNETLRDRYTIEPQPQADVEVLFDDDLKNTFSLGFLAEDGVTSTVT